MVDEQFRQLEREMGLLLRRAQASSATISKQVHPDLEPAAYSLLAMIAASPGVRASDLAANIGVGRGTMSRQLARLGDLGLVSRRPDPDDYRGQLLDLTDEGRQRFETAQGARREFFRDALRDWNDDDIGSFAGHISRLNADLAAARERRS